MNISKSMLRELSESGYFKGKLKEAYMRKSPISVSICTMPIEDAMDLLYSIDLTKRQKLLDFLGRFTEEQIATNGFASQRYAEYVLKGRFKLGEPAIRGNWGGVGGLAGDLWNRYTKTVLNTPPYSTAPLDTAKLTEEGKALYYEFKRMDNQIIPTS
jgi:hypothetical protein